MTLPILFMSQIVEMGQVVTFFYVGKLRVYLQKQITRFLLIFLNNVFYCVIMFILCSIVLISCFFKLLLFNQNNPAALLDWY